MTAWEYGQHFGWGEDFDTELCELHAPLDEPPECCIACGLDSGLTSGQVPRYVEQVTDGREADTEGSKHDDGSRDRA